MEKIPANAIVHMMMDIDDQGFEVENYNYYCTCPSCTFVYSKPELMQYITEKIQIHLWRVASFKRRRQIYYAEQIYN